MNIESLLSTIPDRYLQALQARDASAIAALYADDAVLEDPVGSEPRRGIAAIRQFYNAAVANPISVQRSGPVRVAGNELAFPFTISVPGIRIDVIDTFQFDEAGKIKLMRAFWGPQNTVTE